MTEARARRGVDWLLVGAVIAVAAAVARAIFFTPIEARQGAVQKIFYIHVPAAFIGLYLATELAAFAGALYLWLRDEKLDRVSESAQEVALVFLTVVLITGPIWARPVWGTWWTWDARLTLTLFLWLLVLGYLVLRGAVDDPATRARYSAVLAILAGILVPFDHLTVYLFRTLHPMPIVLKPSAPSLPREMLVTFVFAISAFALLFAALLRARYRYATERDLLASAAENGT